MWTVGLIVLTINDLENNFENNEWKEHNAEKLQEILNRTVSMITAVQIMAYNLSIWSDFMFSMYILMLCIYLFYNKWSRLYSNTQILEYFPNNQVFIYALVPI